VFLLHLINSIKDKLKKVFCQH